MSSTALTATTLRDTVSREGIVLVDFWAGWCGPLSGLRTRLRGRGAAPPDIVFGKVDTESEFGRIAVAP